MKKSSCLTTVLIVVGVFIVLGIIGAILFPRQRIYTEAQINQGFDHAVANNQDTDNSNPITDISVTLEQGIGHVSATWKDGESLTGDIVVSPDGKSLRSQNVVLAGVHPLAQQFFENWADAVIQAGLNSAVARQGQFKEARIESGQIVVIYR